MKLQHSPKGFTLIELLVVISIIALLATMAIPGALSAMEKAKQTQDISRVKQIHIALFSFATDHDGSFPSLIDEDSDSPKGPIVDANDAYQNLIPRYMGSEKAFYTPGAAWTLKAPDENIAAGEKLKAGENSYAYVPGLNNSANGNYPIVADGFSTTVGQYVAIQSDKGGVWKGRVAVVVRVDGTVKLETVNQSGHVMGPTGGATVTDIFATGGGTTENPWLGVKNAPLNPK